MKSVSTGRVEISPQQTKPGPCNHHRRRLSNVITFLNDQD